MYLALFIYICFAHSEISGQDVWFCMNQVRFLFRSAHHQLESCKFYGTFSLHSEVADVEELLSHLRLRFDVTSHLSESLQVEVLPLGSLLAVPVDPVAVHLLFSAWAVENWRGLCDKLVGCLN